MQTSGRDNSAAHLLVNYVLIAELMKLDALEVVSHLPLFESGAAKHTQDWITIRRTQHHSGMCCLPSLFALPLPP